MNFTFSETEKNLFQNIESVLTKEKQLLQSTFQTEKDISEALIDLKQKLSSLDYLNAFNHSKTMGPVANLEMMRIFARYQPSLFLGIEYGFRIFAEMRQWLTESFIQSLKLDNTLPCAVAFCDDLVETNTQSQSITVQADDQHVHLSGQKRFVINAGISKWIVVNGQLDSKNALFFIAPHAEGIEIVPLRNKRIFPELVIANIHFRNCPVEKNKVVCSEKVDAFISNLRLMENFSCIACALGMMDQCIEITKTFAKTYQSENKPLIAHQAVAFSLAEAVTLKQTAELLAYRAAWMTASNDSEKGVMNHCARVFCTESAETIASQCMNILGGQVFVDNHRVEQMLYNCKFIQLLGTSTHGARISIADVILK